MKFGYCHIFSRESQHREIFSSGASMTASRIAGHGAQGLRSFAGCAFLRFTLGLAPAGSPRTAPSTRHSPRRSTRYSRRARHDCAEHAAIRRLRRRRDLQGEPGSEIQDDGRLGVRRDAEEQQHHHDRSGDRRLHLGGDVRPIPTRHSDPSAARNPNARHGVCAVPVAPGRRASAVAVRAAGAAVQESPCCGKTCVQCARTAIKHTPLCPIRPP